MGYILVLDFEGFKQVWPPIGYDVHNPFNGCFIGNGHKIKNLTIDNIHTVNPLISHVAFFGYINSSDALIDNLHLENIKIIGNGSVGGIAAYLMAGTISNCTVTGVLGGVEYAGGITSKSLGKMTNCTFVGSVHGNKFAGALSGLAIAEFRNCTARGLVYEGGKRVEKLFGESRSTTPISCEFIQDENWKTSLTEAPATVTEAPKIKLIALNRFDTDFLFCNGLLGIRNNETGKWGFIDEEGNVAIDFVWEYDQFKTPKFNGGSCAVYKTENGQKNWYILDKKGAASRVYGVVKVSTFQTGVAHAIKKTGNLYKQVYINSRGQEIYPALAKSLPGYWGEDCLPPRPFSDGLAAFFSAKEKKYGFINNQGKVIVPAIYEEVQDFSEGLAAVQTASSGTSGSRWGYINTSGEMVIPAKFSNNVLPFSEGYASVEKSDKTVVVINKQGEVVSPVFKDVRQFHKGYAYVRLLQNDRVAVIDKDFRVVREMDQRTGFKFPSRALVPLVFVNDYVKSSDFGENALFNYKGDQNSLSTGYYRANTFSDNLVHFKGRGKLVYNNGNVDVTWLSFGGYEINGFMDYRGNIHIIIGQDEF